MYWPGCPFIYCYLLLKICGEHEIVCLSYLKYSIMCQLTHDLSNGIQFASKEWLYILRLNKVKTMQLSEIPRTPVEVDNIEH